jgi:Skp family chaperone for outer membrane proteins
MPYTQSVGLLPSISARNLFKKGRVGFDEFVVDAQGVAPDPPSDADLFVGHIQTAVQREYDTCAALDGATIDFEAAALDLDEAMLSLHAARDQLQLLTETAETRKAGKRLSQTEKKTQSALAKIGKRKEEPAIKRIQQAIRRAVEASLLIEPRNL